MAACYEQMGEYEEAADYYKKASDLHSIKSQTADFLLNAGINYIKSGQNDVAKELLETILNEYKSTTAAAEVNKYLSQLDN